MTNLLKCAMVGCQSQSVDGLFCTGHTGAKIALKEVRRTGLGKPDTVEDLLGISKKALENSCRRFWLFVGSRRSITQSYFWAYQAKGSYRD